MIKLPFPANSAGWTIFDLRASMTLGYASLNGVT